MDRNLNLDGRGKYALLHLRKLATHEGQGPFDGLAPEIAAAVEVLDRAGVIEWGEINSADEFFVIKLKDAFAEAALLAYADAASLRDQEWAAEVRDLAKRSGPHHPTCKMPD